MLDDDKSLHGSLAGTGTAFEEGLRALVGGALFGLVSPFVGHPLDTVKTKMQTEAKYQKMKIIPVIAEIWKADKIRGFYKGFVPPLVASSAYRSIQFSAYAATFSACEHVPFLAEPIPFTGGLRISVLLGACASAFARATIESPFDFIKVRKQTGSPWYIGDGSLKSMISPQMVRQLYNGYIPTLKRTLLLMGSFFILVDYSVRYIPDVINMPVYGPFFKGGICATAAWTFAFPFETVKNVMQADMTGKYSGKTSTQVMQLLYNNNGVRGLYRGFAPGASRSFIANGVSMCVYSWFQDYTR
mmetsp:Transcript_27049/g.38769  ORF Transcript_27049/g.38769 Transcript_27049/m.38769 type:complete len:301 (-) Transcript_27049:766-1668(-)